MSERITSEKPTSAEAGAQFVKAFADWMPGGLVHVAANGRILHANAKAAELLGLSYEALTDRYTADFETQTIWEDGTPCADADYPVTRALVTGESQEPVTIGVRRPDGHVTWAIFTAVPVRSDDGETVTGVMVLFVDLTERKRAQAEQDALETRLREAEQSASIARLTGGIAHDINNLMTVVLGHAEAIRAKHPVCGDHALEIERAAERAADLTRHLLAFGRQQLLHLEPIRLDDFVSELCPRLRRLVGPDANFEFEPNAGSDMLRGDLAQLTHVIESLVANAGEAIGPGGAVVVRTSRDGEWLDVVVSDDGPGMTPEVLARAFEPFFTTKFGRSGRGLGLSSVQGIVAQCGGTIELHTTEGVGTTVRIRFKRVHRHQSRPELRAVKRADPRGLATDERRRPTVLLAEDEDGVRFLFARALKLAGYDVCEAANGSDALALAQAKPFDVLVTDILMPGMSGVELARALRAGAPGLPVLFMTGFAEPPSLTGLDDTLLLQKPFAPDRLVAALAEVRAKSTELAAASDS